MRTIQEIASMLSKSKYLDIQIIDNKIYEYKFLEHGLLFMNKIKTIWKQNNGTISTYLIPNETVIESSLNNNKLDADDFKYLKSEKFRKNFLHVKNNFQKEIPLAFKDELNFKLEKYQEIQENNNDKLRENKTVLTCSYFVNDKLGVENFYKIQREHKIWWMKLSSNPGRYYLSDLKLKLLNNNQKSNSVKIKSKFVNLDLDVENVCVIPLKALKLENQYEFFLKDLRLNKRIIPSVIKTEIDLEIAVLNFLLDSVEDSINGKMSINRKIAPYQCCIFYFSQEFQELAIYLNDIICKCGITSIIYQEDIFEKRGLKEGITEMDKIGVPYNIILEPTCLDNGLMKLRNRETTLSEIIHISDIPDYLLKIFNS